MRKPAGLLRARKGRPRDGMKMEKDHEQSDVQAALDIEQGDGTLDLEQYSPLQAYYLDSLDRLIKLKATYLDDPGHEEWLIKAIDRAAYASFRSCVELDTTEEAKALLSREDRG